MKSGLSAFDELKLGGRRTLVEHNPDGSYDGFLYVIRSESYLKVGFSNRPDRRLYSWFHNDSHSPLGTPLKFISDSCVLGIVRCTSTFERAIHRRFFDEQVDLGFPRSQKIITHLSDWYPVNGRMHEFVRKLPLIPAKEEWYRR